LFLPPFHDNGLRASRRHYASSQGCVFGIAQPSRRGRSAIPARATVEEGRPRVLIELALDEMPPETFRRCPAPVLLASHRMTRVHQSVMAPGRHDPAQLQADRDIWA
jgi:hypothetical protein